MKKITTLLLILASLLCVQAQEISQNDVTCWFGNGDEHAYFIIDFNDQSTTESYIWGYRFDGNQQPTMLDMLLELQSENTGFSIEHSGNFLDYAFYNNQGDDSGIDWWKVWSNNTFEGLSTNSGIGSSIQPGYFYALTYGFMCGEICDLAPDFPISPCTNLSINENSFSNSTIKIYPNPTSNIVNIHVTEIENIENVSVLDLGGREVLKSKNTKVLNVQDLSSGTYILIVKTNQTIYNKKLIIK